MVTFHGEPPTHLTYDGLEAVGVRHAFTTRHHGSLPGLSVPGGPFAADLVGPALRALGVDGAAIHFARQVHGTTSLVTDGARPGLVGTGDALITATPGTPLAIFTADCLAVIVADPERRVLAVAHAGWRGTVGGLLGRLGRALVTRFGVRPDRLWAAIGPSIGPCCYEVDAPVIEPLRRAFPADWGRWTRPRGTGKWALDLWQANADQLTAAGLRPDAVLNARLCTGCRRDLFFSYRKEGTGVRMAALARLT
ncbi:MAG: polyphenol oxidase family protein [Candidatus Rokuibacteriota bacterium]